MRWDSLLQHHFPELLRVRYLLYSGLSRPGHRKLTEIAHKSDVGAQAHARLQLVESEPLRREKCFDSDVGQRFFYSLHVTL